MPQPHTTSKWLLKKNLFHVGNIYYDQHLLLLTRHCTQKTYNLLKQSFLASYFHKQHKDWWYIRHAFHIPKLTLHTHECNPNKDFITSKPLIQMHPPFAQIHDHTGAYQTSIPLNRLFWLWECFFSYTSHPYPCVHPPQLDFATLPLGWKRLNNPPYKTTPHHFTNKHTSLFT